MPLPFARLHNTMAHAMNFRLQRHNMISANLANIDTPNYTPVELQFQGQLETFLSGSSPMELKTTHNSHRNVGGFGEGPSFIEPIEQGEVEFDVYSLPDQKGNSVDIDHESAKMAENQLIYRALTTAYKKRGWYSMVLEGNQ